MLPAWTSHRPIYRIRKRAGIWTAICWRCFAEYPAVEQLHAMNTALDFNAIRVLVTTHHYRHHARAWWRW